MPVIGKIIAKTYDYCLENMEIGMSGYVHSDDIIVTKLAIFIDRISEVLLDDETGEDMSGYIPIKRIGGNFEEEDFELDFSNCDDYEIYILKLIAYILI